MTATNETAIEAPTETDAIQTPAMQDGKQVLAHLSYKSGYVTTKLYDDFKDATSHLSLPQNRSQAGGLVAVEMEVVDDAAEGSDGQ